MAEVTKKKLRNLFIFLGLGTLQLLVIFQGLAKYFSYTIPILPLQFMLLGIVGIGLIFIATF